ncbi:hypothetical protein ACFL2J_02105 [Candidatus Omnitrophota bacterium]
MERKSIFVQILQILAIVSLITIVFSFFVRYKYGLDAQYFAIMCFSPFYFLLLSIIYRRLKFILARRPREIEK